MAFSKKSLAGSNGLGKAAGNVVPADEQSNKGPTSSSKTIGTVKGRLSFSKSSVTSLNKGVCPYRDDKY